MAALIRSLVCGAVFVALSLSTAPASAQMSPAQMKAQKDRAAREAAARAQAERNRAASHRQQAVQVRQALDAQQRTRRNIDLYAGKISRRVNDIFIGYDSVSPLAKIAVSELVCTADGQRYRLVSSAGMLVSVQAMRGTWSDEALIKVHAASIPACWTDVLNLTFSVKSDEAFHPDESLTKLPLHNSADPIAPPIGGVIIDRKMVGVWEDVVSSLELRTINLDGKSYTFFTAGTGILVNKGKIFLAKLQAHRVENGQVVDMEVAEIYDLPEFLNYNKMDYCKIDGVNIVTTFDIGHKNDKVSIISKGGEYYLFMWNDGGFPICGIDD